MSLKSWAGMENVRGKRRISSCFAGLLLMPEVGLEPTLPEGIRVLSPSRFVYRCSWLFGNRLRKARFSHLGLLIVRRSFWWVGVLVGVPG